MRAIMIADLQEIPLVPQLPCTPMSFEILVWVVPLEHSVALGHTILGGHGALYVHGWIEETGAPDQAVLLQ